MIMMTTTEDGGTHEDVITRNDAKMQYAMHLQTLPITDLFYFINLSYLRQIICISSESSKEQMSSQYVR